MAIAALHRELRGHTLREIGRTLEGLPAGQLALALGLTALGYGVLTFYDQLAVRYAGKRLPYRTVAAGSFVSYALSHNLGMAALTSVPMRFRFYAAAGLGPTEIARIVVFVGATFWLGVVALGGAAFVAEPLGLPPSWNLGLHDTRVVGIGFLALTGAYLAAVTLYRRPLRLRSFELQLPSLRLAVLQVLVASADLAAACAALYVLLPAATDISFPRFLSIYLLALTAGLISQVPGGLGVFEAVVVATLPGEIPGAAVLATLLAYRAVYYVLPLFVAGGVLAAFELRRHRKTLAPMIRGARSWGSALAPHGVAAVVFLAGGVLLVSGAILGLPERLRHLGHYLPLSMIEASHLLGSVVGVCLLFVARGLQRRLDSAYLITVGLLVAGIVASLVKGLDYEEAAFLGVVLLVLLPTREVFYRKGSLLAERFTTNWFAAVAVVLGASFWLGLLAFRHVSYSADLWWQFSLHGGAPRFLRAAGAVVVVAAGVGFAKLVGPARPESEPASADAVDRAATIVARSLDSGANLALLGDKSFLFNADATGFVMYGVASHSASSTRPTCSASRRRSSDRRERSSPSPT